MAKKSALDGLAAKLEAAAATHGMDPLIKLAKAKWDPAKHPHGKHGYWAHKGEAVYHALLDLANMKATKGDFAKPGMYDAKSAQYGAVKVGGITIGPPVGEEGDTETIDYALKPGETAYMVTTPTSQTVTVVHPDNTATELKATEPQLPPEIIKQYGPGQFQVKALTPDVTAEKIDEHPAEAGAPTTSVGSLIISASQAEALPTGAVIRKRNIKYAHVWEDWQKQPDGGWERIAAFKASTPTGAKKDSAAFGALIEAGKSSFVVSGLPEGAPAAPHATVTAMTDTGEVKKIPAKKAGPKLSPPKKPEAPTGPVTFEASDVVTANHMENHLGTSNKFYETAVISDPEGGAWHLTRYGSTKPGAHVTVTAKKYDTLEQAAQAHHAITKSKIDGGYIIGSMSLPTPTHAAYAEYLADHVVGSPAAPVPFKKPLPFKKSAAAQKAAAVKKAAAAKAAAKHDIAMPGGPFAEGQEVTNGPTLLSLPIGTVLRNTAYNGFWGDYMKTGDKTWVKIAKSNQEFMHEVRSHEALTKLANSENSKLVIKSLPVVFKVGDPVPSMEVADQLPVGTEITYLEADDSVTWTKTADEGMWVSPGGGKYYLNWLNWMHPWTITALPDQPSDQPEITQMWDATPGAKVGSKEHAAALPDGTRIKAASTTFVKVNGNWYLAENDNVVSEIQANPSGWATYNKIVDTYVSEGAATIGPKPVAATPTITEKQLHDLPAGSKVSFKSSVDGVGSAYAVKQPNGIWSATAADGFEWSLDDQILASDYGTPDGELKIVEIGMPEWEKDLLAPAVGQVVTKGEVDSLPVGTELMFGDNLAVWTKQPDGNWVNEAWSESMPSSTMNWNGETWTIKSLPSQQPAAPSTGQQITSKSELDALPLGSVIDFPEWGSAGVDGKTSTFFKNLEGNWINEGQPAMGSWNGAITSMLFNGKSVFVVSAPGATKDVPQQPEAAPGPVPGTNVVLGAGESLYQSASGKTNKWAIVKDGKVIKLLDKDTGADLADSMTEGNYKSALWNWNKSLKDGKLSLAGGTAQAAEIGKVKPKVGDPIGKSEAAALPIGSKIVLGSVIWTKVAGGWQSPHGELVSPEMDWNNPWKLGYAAPPAKKAPKGAAAAAVTSENSTYTLPNGKVLKPGPGEHVLKPPPDFPYAAYVSAWLLDSTGKLHAYDQDGKIATSKWYTSSGKKSAKGLVSKGATLLASGPEKQVAELPVGVPDKQFASDIALTQYVFKTWYSSDDTFADLVIGVMKAAQQGSEYVDRYETLSDPEVTQKIANLLASVIAGRDQHKGSLNTTEKSKLAKYIKSATAILRIGVVAQKLNDPDYEPTEQDYAELDEIAEGSYAYGLEDAESMAMHWRKRLDQAKFSHTVKGLGFDPLHATPEQAQQYAANHGAINAAGMTPEDAKEWMLLDLKAPGTSGNKEAIETRAGVAIKVAAVAANAKAVAAKKAALSPSDTEVESKKAVTAKLAAVYSTIAKMYDHYSGPDGQEMVWSAETNTWYRNGVSLDATVAAETVKEPGWEADGNKIGSPIQKVAAFLDVTWPNWKQASPETIKALGSPIVAGAPFTSRSQWLRAFLRGDVIAMYEIEKMFGGPADDHPGSPESTNGKLARQALSNYLAAQPWWHPDKPDPLEWPQSDVDAATEALGLVEAVTAAGGAPSQYGVLKKWITYHKNLPEPQTEDVQTGPVTITTEGGASIEVQPGWLVAKSKYGAVAVFGDDGWFSNNAGTAVFSPNNYGFTYDDKISGHADLIKSGYTDITPAWAPSHGGLKVSKPASIPQDAWDAATGAEAGGAALKALIGEWATKSDDEVNYQINYLGAATVAPKDKLLIAQAPDAIKRIAVWTRSSTGNPELAANILKAIIAKARGGEYITPETQTWTPPGGQPIVIPPGASLYLWGSGYALVTGPKSGFALSSEGVFVSGVASPSTIAGIAAGEKVAESLANVTPEKAALEGFEFSEQSWAALAAAESAGWSGDGPEAAAAYRFKQALENVPNTAYSEQFAALVPKIHTLPPGVKALLVKAAKNKDTDQLTAILWKIGKGVYSSQPTVPSHPLFDPGAEYAPQIASGHISTEAVDQYWSWSAMVAFGDEYGLDTSVGSWELAEAISAKIEQINNDAQPKLTEQDPKSDPAKSLILTWIKPGPGSHKGTGIYTDQYGDTWLGKNFPDDPYNDMRVQAEHACNVAGKMFGFDTPFTFVREIKGTLTYVQHWDDSDGTMEGKGPGDVNDNQLAELMQSQVLNWMVGNQDAWDTNFLLHPDGNSIIVIDLGQAFKHFHDDQLKPGYLPAGNYVAQWYDQFFAAVKSGKITRERAEMIARRVLFKAYQVQQQNDAAYEALISKMLDSRPKGSYPKKYPNKAAFLAAAMERKHNLVHDFEEMYRNAWEQAGWDWEIDTEDFGKKIGDAHTSVGPQFCEELSEAPASGVAVMVDSPGGSVVDAHIVFTPMKAKGGGTTVLAFAKLRDEADKAFTAWLKEHVEGPMASGGHVPEVVAPPGHDLPGVPQFYETLIAYAKTVGMHAPNGGKEPDGAYNVDKVNSFNAAYESTKADLAKVLEHREKDPTKPKSSGVPKFETLEQQDAWVTAIQEMLLQCDQVKQAHAKGQPVQNLFPDVGIPPNGGYKQITYTPTKDLGEPGKVAEKYLVGGDTYIRTADGGHYFVTSDGKKHWVSRNDFLDAVSAATVQKVPVTDEGDAAEEIWKNPSTGKKYVRVKDAPHLWQLFGPDGTQDGDPVTKDEMNEALGSDPEAWVYDPDGSIEEKTIETKLDGKQLKVTHANAATHSGQVDFKTGKMVETKSGDSTEFQTGTDYVVSYDGVKIRYRPWSEPGVTKAQQGNLSIEIKDWDGQPARIEDVLDTLGLMGVEINPATEASLELHYWRHNLEQIKKSGHKNPESITKVEGEIAKRIKPGMTQEQELQAYRDAFSVVFGADKVENAPWQPQFITQFGQVGGKPTWVRADVSLEDLRKVYHNTVPIHGVFVGDNDDPVDRAVMIIQSDAVLPSEERVRILGKLLPGMSSKSDQGHGSSGVVFTRQNTGPFDYGSVQYAFLLDPRDAMRVGNYAIYGDQFGAFGQATGTFDPAMWTYSDDNNELCIKDSSAIKYAVCKSEAARATLLERLKAAGVVKVHGMPIEEFVLGPNAWKAKMKQIWDEVLAESGMVEAAA